MPKMVGNKGEWTVKIPTMDDRARQALDLQALQPIAETTADPHSYGFRPQRRCADAIDQCLKVLRQHTSAAWILAGDLEGFFDPLAFSWREKHIPMHTQVVSQWLRSGCIDRGALFPTTTGVPQGGSVSPVISHMVLDGLEAVVHGRSWHRRTHHINEGRWAADFMVTANARQVFENTVLPRITAFCAERGVRLSTTKTVITPLAQGFDFLGQTLRQHARRHGTRAKRHIPPSKASLQTITTKITTLCKQAAGATPEHLIGTLTPV
jgi:RNA-directed DNA polymerase